MDAGDETFVVEHVSFVSKKVEVFRIPPAQITARRYLCQEWEGGFVCNARLKAISRADNLVIRLENENTGELVAECPVAKEGRSPVEKAVDSGRGFVLLAVDRDSKRTAFLGVMFEQRGEAFDFAAAIFDNRRREEAEKQAEESFKGLAGAYSLSAGSSMSVNVPTVSKVRSENAEEEEWDDFTSG